MKKIGIDARLYNKTGVGVYIRNLLHYLQIQNQDNLIYYVYLMPEEYDTVNFSSNNFIKRRSPYKWHTVSEQLGFYLQLYKDKLDLMHFTYFSYPVLYRRKFIATIHDTILLDYKTGRASTKNSLIYKIKHFFFRYVIASQITNAIQIITPTQTVKQNLINIYGNKYDSKIYVIYEGVDYEMFTKKQNESLVEKMPKKFYLYVGNFYPHKNVETLIRAFADTIIDTKLLLVGPDDYFSQRIRNLIKQLKQTDRIVIYNNASTEDLIYFYKNACALVHPSLAEGFGLPLIEAAYFQLPIFASNIPVFKELMHDTFHAFDPTDVSSLTALFNEEENHRIIPDYSSILIKYSFQKMSQEIEAMYKSL